MPAVCFFPLFLLSAVWDEGRSSSSHFGPRDEAIYWRWCDRKLDLWFPDMTMELPYPSQNVCFLIFLHDRHIIIPLKLFHLEVFCICIRILSNYTLWYLLEICYWYLKCIFTHHFRLWWYWASMFGKITKSKAVLFCCFLSELALSRNVLSRLPLWVIHIWCCSCWVYGVWAGRAFVII